MDVEALLRLRAQIDAKLAERRRDLEKQLSRFGGASESAPSGRGAKRGPRKGGKVAPKYRDPKSGMTWAGRGIRPKWLTAALKGGAKVEDFLIDKSARGKK